MSLRRYLFFLCCMLSFAFADKNVLVLHSYHHGLDWTDSVSKGLIDTVSRSPEKIHLYFEYLDAKRNFGDAFLKRTFEYFSIKHASSHFDAIVVSDNDALNFINHYGKALFKEDIPVIFTGINHYTKEMTSHIKEVAGVKEVVDYAQTLSIAQTLFPKRTKVLIALDDTLTARRLLEEFQPIAGEWKDRLHFYYLNDMNDEALAEFAKQYKDEYLIYLLAYNRHKTGKFFGYEESVAQIQKILGEEVPIVGSWSFFMGKGIVGGALTSGITQGKLCGELLMQVLSGVKASALPLLSNVNDKSVVLDYKMLEYFRLKKPLMLNASYINEPEDFFTRHKSALLVVSGVVSFFALLLVLLVWRNGIKNKALKHLNEILEKAIERAIEESKKSETLFRFIADSSPYVIFILDENYRLTYINDKVKDYFGKEVNSLCGCEDFHFLPVEYHNDLALQLEKLRENPTLTQLKFETYCASIEKFMKNYLTPMRSPDGALLGFKGVIRDITEERMKLDTLRQEAQTDPLTGMLNRTTFEKELLHLFRAYQTLSKETCLMMMDMDYFKTINDIHGHVAGDHMLRHISHLLRSNVRKSDFVFRYGGEEFAIVLPDINLADVLLLAEKIRESIEKHTFVLPEITLHVTISIGVSLFKEEDTHINAIVSRADTALYRAKNAGRNRTEVEI